MSRILIVDDDPQSRRILSEGVQALGIGHHCCSDGIHALDALRCNSDFALMITDVAMPVLDGRQLLAYVRADRNLPDIPIMVTSGVIGPSEIARLLDAGAAGFLPKPLHVAAVRDGVSSCLAECVAAV
jgi:CheY-like chemotaxis protein